MEGIIITVGRMAGSHNKLLKQAGAKVRLLGGEMERRLPDQGYPFFGMAFIELPENTKIEPYDLDNARDLIESPQQGRALREYGKVVKLTFPNGQEFAYADAFDKTHADLFQLPWPPEDDF